MAEPDHHWIGTGDTPLEAIRDVAPDTDASDIAWVEGIRGRLVDEPPDETEKSIKHDITVIYEERPAEEWRIEATYEDEEWEAVFIGSKKI